MPAQAIQSFRKILSCQCRLGESPVWDHERGELAFVDILGRAIHRYNPFSGHHECAAVDEDVGCIAPAHEGGYVAGLRSGVWRLNHDGTKLESLAANPEDLRRSRLNDGAVDPRGRLPGRHRR